ncbi:hypothetical protein pb186bvf_012512 [Paramecium bursaria]
MNDLVKSQNVFFSKSLSSLAKNLDEFDELETSLQLSGSQPYGKTQKQSASAPQIVSPSIIINTCSSRRIVENYQRPVKNTEQKSDGYIWL